MLLKIINNVAFFSRQGISLRGHDEAESNVMQLLLLRGKDDPEINQWIKKDNKYTSPVILNEIMHLMSLQILRNIALDLNSAKCFTIMADECTDSSIKEHLLCFRWVNKELEVH